jgi:hypothetical protein
MGKEAQQEDFSPTPWTVEELIEAATRIMASTPELFESAGGGKKELNVRLIRDYVVRGMIPRPVRIGREARFGFDHLVHLLAVRVLLRSEKWSLSAIKVSLANVASEELLNSPLARVRSRIEAEYKKAARPERGRAPQDLASVATPPLNPAQLLIEKIKIRHNLGLSESQAKYSAAAFDRVAMPAAAAKRTTREPRSKLHIDLEPGCEVVIDDDRLRSLNKEQIERLAEALKRRLEIEKAR